MNSILRATVPLAHLKKFWIVLSLVGFLIGVSAVSLFSSQSFRGAVPGATFPGEQIWNNGTSSLLFGTNDTQEFSQQNLDNSSAIQQALKTSGVTLIRTVFADNASDASIDQRLQVVSSVGATCLGIISNPANVTYDVHLIQHAAPQCPLWEIGNEPDFNNVPVATYSQEWNTLVPQLRQAASTTTIKIIGPVLASANIAYLTAFLQATKTNLPDAISFHWYPCTGVPDAATCQQKAGTLSQTIQEVANTIQQTAGVTIPVGITEWNADAGNPPATYVDDANFITSFTTTTLAQMAASGVLLANQFDAASGAGSGHLDMIDTQTAQPKAQLLAMAQIIAAARTCTTPIVGTPTTGIPTLTPTVPTVPTTPTSPPATPPVTNPIVTPTTGVTLPCTPTPCPTTSTGTPGTTPIVPTQTATSTSVTPGPTPPLIVTTTTPTGTTATPSVPCQLCPTVTPSPTIAVTPTGVIQPIVTPPPGTPCTQPTAMSWPTFDGDMSRGSENQSETIISPSTVGKLSLIYKEQLPARVDSSPIEQLNVLTPSGQEDVLFLTTTDGRTLALNAASGKILWSQQPQAVTPTIVKPLVTTATPVLDPKGASVYSYGLDGKIHKYSVVTGKESVGGGWPVTVTLTPAIEKESSAINIGKGYLYVTISGFNGDKGSYIGHIVAINLTNGTSTVFNALCSTVHTLLPAKPGSCPTTGAGIWARGGAVVDPVTGNLFVVTGNASFNPRQGDFGDSIIELSPDLTKIIDTYTPTTFATLQAQDADLGSAAPVLLPTQITSKTPYLLVHVGKDHFIRLINRQNMSGQGSMGHTGGYLQRVAMPDTCEVFTQPLSMRDAQGMTWVFIADSCGLTALKVVTSASGKTSITLAYHLTTVSGSSPLLVNGVLFIQGNHVITALDPSTGRVEWSSTQSSAHGTIGSLHWQSPLVFHGRLYVVDESGKLTTYGIAATG